MKYIKQFSIILGISLLGELIHHFVPLPIPASIYGIGILFFCLKCRLIPLEAVADVGNFLIEIMPLMFIPAAVGLLESWGVVKDSIGKYLIIIPVSSIAVFAVSGLVTQFLLRRKKKKEDSHE